MKKRVTQFSMIALEAAVFTDDIEFNQRGNTIGNTTVLSLGVGKPISGLLGTVHLRTRLLDRRSEYLHRIWSFALQRVFSCAVQRFNPSHCDAWISMRSTSSASKQKLKMSRSSCICSMLLVPDKGIMPI